MAGIEYSSSTQHKTWTLPVSWTKHRRVTCGVWFRKTVDRPLVAPFSSSESLSRNTYLPLEPGQIRLLKLNPGLPSDPVTGSLIHVPLHRNMSFEALSYTWGPQGFGGVLKLKTGSLDLNTNLALALSDLRSPTVTRTLWIDAICIDQWNMVEKGEQVQLMTEIYAAASRVVIWLGSSTTHSGLGMRILEQFLTAQPFDYHTAWRALPSSLVIPALTDIIQRTWFTRYWVVQEAAVAQEVMMVCGPHHIQWKNECSTVSACERSIKLAVTSPQWSQAGLDVIDMSVLLGLFQMQLETGPQSAIWAQRRRGPDLLEFAYNMRHRHATDVRDRIYALVGLAGKTSATTITPDYTKPAEEVYAEFSQLVAEQTRAIRSEFDVLQAKLDDQSVSSLSFGPTPAAVSGDSKDTLQTFIENACAQAIRDVRRDDPREAAKLLESTAMFLRGESFAPRPSAA